MNLTLMSLFDGSGGFPLAGAMHGARDLVEKAMEQREWKHLKTYYYPNRKEQRI